MSKRSHTITLADGVTGITPGTPYTSADTYKGWEFVIETTGGTVDGSVSLLGIIGGKTSVIALLSFTTAGSHGPFIDPDGHYDQIQANVVSNSGTFTVVAKGTIINP